MRCARRRDEKPVHQRRRTAADGAKGRFLIGHAACDAWVAGDLRAATRALARKLIAATTPAAKMKCNDEAAASMEQALRRRRPLHRRPSQISETLHSKRTL